MALPWDVSRNCRSFTLVAGEFRPLKHSGSLPTPSPQKSSRKSLWRRFARSSKRWFAIASLYNDPPVMTSAAWVKPGPVDNAGAFDVELVRKDFPILRRSVGGKPLVYL